MFQTDDSNALARKWEVRFDRAQSLRFSFGIAMLVLGLAIVVGILIQAKQLLDGPDDAYLLRKIAAIDASQLTITWTNGKVSLPPNVLMVSAYVIAIFILLICAGLAGTLIRSGATLLMSISRPKDADDSRSRV